MVATATRSHSSSDTLPPPAELSGILLRVILAHAAPGPDAFTMSRIDRMTRELSAAGVAPSDCRSLVYWSMRFYSPGGWRRHGRAAIRQRMIDLAAAIAVAARGESARSRQT
ncbi:MAG: hypothetical protein JNM18_16800 [Planctomycetaceae bacterium]|nr:hypothetical protein [Planctomycetaceae bacterium]